MQSMGAKTLDLHIWADAVGPLSRVLAEGLGLRVRMADDRGRIFQDIRPHNTLPGQGLLLEREVLSPTGLPVRLQLLGTREQNTADFLEGCRRCLDQLAAVLKEETAALRLQHRAHQLYRLRRSEVDLLFRFTPLHIQRDSRGLALGALIDGVAELLDEGYAVASLLSCEYSRIRGRVRETPHEQIEPATLPWSEMGSRILAHLAHPDQASHRWFTIPDGAAAEIERRCGSPLAGFCVPIEVEDRALGYLAVLRPRGRHGAPGPSARLLRGLAHRVSSALASIHLQSERHLFLFNTVKSLIAVVEAKDRYTRGHSERVHYLAMQTGARLNLPVGEMESLNWAAILHDIGKLYVPGRVLGKAGKLDSQEWDLIRSHPERGCHILLNIPRLSSALPGIRHHHENFGGGGYPDGLQGEEIPRLARIIAAADAFDALTSDRPYLRHVSCRNALEVLREKSGSKFDPQVVEAITRVVESEMLSGSLAFEALRPHARDDDTTAA